MGGAIEIQGRLPYTHTYKFLLGDEQGPLCTVKTRHGFWIPIDHTTTKTMYGFNY